MGFYVRHENLEVIKLCKTEIENWFSDIGLELKLSKTRLAHTLNIPILRKPKYVTTIYEKRKYTFTNAITYV